METAYRESIEQTSVALLASLKSLKFGENESVAGWDAKLRSLLQHVGAGVYASLVGERAQAAVDEARGRGLRIDKQRTIKVTTLFGVVSLSSPSMRGTKKGSYCRPVRDALGFGHGHKTAATKRALTDFGIEDSFAHAACRFAEHYGFEVGRTSLLRVVDSAGDDAETYVASKLLDAVKEFESTDQCTAGVDQLLIELDGSMVPTVRAPAGQPLTRSGPKERAWREVRVGLARSLDAVDATYVARIGSYDEVCGDLFGAALCAGMGDNSRVVGVADGGNGLREGLDAKFAGLEFLLDRPHLKQHLYETAEALGRRDAARHDWVEGALLLIDNEQLDTLTAFLDAQDNDRAIRLAGYLRRFHDALWHRQARDDGFPIGSGEVESAHRIPQKRLKLPGAAWKPESVNRMLALRVIRANGWWDDFWSAPLANKLAA